MTRTVWLSMALLTATARAGSAQEYSGPAWGGSGGTGSYNLDCGSAGVMVGVYGKTGLWIDAIGVTCRRVNSDGTLGSTYTRGPSGGSGGTGADTSCPAGTVVAAVTGYSGSYVNALVLNCYRWSAASRRPDYGARVDRAFWFGSSAMGSPNSRVQCPAEKAGKAMRGKYGGYIDSLQFVCDDYNK